MKTTMIFSAIAVLIACLSCSTSAQTQPATPKKRIVGIVLYEGAETLDFAGPYEVFAVAHTHDNAPASGEQGMMGPMRRLFDVRIIAATMEPVTLSGGLKIVPTDTFESCPKIDVLVVPGGGQGQAVEDKAMVTWVAKAAITAELVTSVCTGSFILGEAGLLDGKQSATHHLSVDAMQEKYPKTTVVTGKRFVEDGNVITSAGVSSGLDMSLYIVSKLYDDNVAKMAAGIMEYPYPAVSDSRRAGSAQ